MKIHLVYGSFLEFSQASYNIIHNDKPIKLTHKEMTNAVKTILYYLIVGLVIFSVIKLYPSGSYGTSLEVLIFLGINILSIVLLFICLAKSFKGEKTTKISTLLHFLGCAALLIYFFTADQYSST